MFPELCGKTQSYRLITGEIESDSLNIQVSPLKGR